jgi:hypothetical protein
MGAMTVITLLTLLTIQSLLGAFDNLWHHELSEDLRHRPEARTELALHTGRELLYAVIFAGIAWYRWQGSWALVFVALLGIEIVHAACPLSSACCIPCSQSISAR